MSAAAAAVAAATLVLVGGGPAWAGGAAAYQVSSTIGVGRSPYGVAVDPGTHTVYVANLVDGSVSVLDEASDTVTATVGVGRFPIGVAVDPGTHTVYVTNFHDDSVSVLDEASDTVIATVGVGHSPYGIAVDPSTHTVYVADSGSSSVSVLDETTNTVTATVGVGTSPFGVAVDPVMHIVYVADSGSRSVSVLDGASDTVTATVGVGSDPIGVAVDPGTRAVYVNDFNDDTVSVLDGASDTVTATVGVGSEPFGVAVDPGTQLAYVADSGDDTVSVISPIPLPVVSGVSPMSGVAAGGAQVTISGSGFTAATGVLFGSVAATSIGVVSDRTITAVVPAHAAGLVNVYVRGPAGQSTQVRADHFLFAATPTITALTPAAGPLHGGQKVTITGSGFGATSTVHFGDTQSPAFTQLSSTQIRATVPPGSVGAVDVTVTARGGTSPTASTDQYTYVAAPVLTSLSPDSGSTDGGTTLTVTGSGLDAATSVHIGATNVPFTVVSDTELTCTTPAHTRGVVYVHITSPGGTTTTSTNSRYRYLTAG